MKERLLSFLTLVKLYLVNLLSAIFAHNLTQWKVFYIGELGVRQLNFKANEFFPTERLFLKAEQVEGLQKGQINDVYNQVKIDEVGLVAIYCKQIDN